MGLFDSIKNIFSKSDQDKPKKKKKTTGKKVAKSGAPKKKKKKIATKESSPKAPLKKKKKKPIKKKKKPDKQEKPTRNLLFSLNKKGKKRKKSKQIQADPINEEALGFSISLKGEDEKSKKRNALRITVEGLTVHVSRLNKQFPVSDISATGLGFEFEKPRVKGGVKLKMDLFLNGELKASEIECKVMRHDRGSVGCIFEELDRAQDDAVHEVVLLGQKQQTAKKNAHKDREFVIPD